MCLGQEPKESNYRISNINKDSLKDYEPQRPSMVGVLRRGINMTPPREGGVRETAGGTKKQMSREMTSVLTLLNVLYCFYLLLAELLDAGGWSLP